MNSVVILSGAESKNPVSPSKDTSTGSLDSARGHVGLDKPNLQGEEELSGAGWAEVRTGVLIR